MIDLKPGEGEPAVDGDVVVMHFKGWQDRNGETGSPFIDSRIVGDPLSFVLGTERVMKGWNEGIRGMRAGGERRLMIPSELAYGEKGAGELVPPDTDVIFDIEVLEVRNRE